MNLPSHALRREFERSLALSRAAERLRREGPFAFDIDDPDGVLLLANGRRVLYVDDSSIVTESP